MATAVATHSSTASPSQSPANEREIKAQEIEAFTQRLATHLARYPTIQQKLREIRLYTGDGSLRDSVEKTKTAISILLMEVDPADFKGIPIGHRFLDGVDVFDFAREIRSQTKEERTVASVNIYVRSDPSSPRGREIATHLIDDFLQLEPHLDTQKKKECFLVVHSPLKISFRRLEGIEAAAMEISDEIDRAYILNRLALAHLDEEQGFEKAMKMAERITHLKTKKKLFEEISLVMLEKKHYSLALAAVNQISEDKNEKALALMRAYRSSSHLYTPPYEIASYVVRNPPEITEDFTLETAGYLETLADMMITVEELTQAHELITSRMAGLDRECMLKRLAEAHDKIGENERADEIRWSYTHGEYSYLVGKESYSTKP